MNFDVFSRAELSRFKSKIDSYERATGSKLNNGKCALLTPHPHHWNDGNRMGFAAVPDSGEKVLGFNINNKGLVGDLSDRVDKIRKDLISWKHLNLALTQKVGIVRVYILSRFTYHLTLMELSERNKKELRNVINWFLWSNTRTFDPQKTHKATMSFARLAQVKTNGGLSLILVSEIELQRHAWVVFFFLNRKDSWWRKAYMQELQEQHPCRFLGVKAIDTLKFYHLDHWPILNRAVSALRLLCSSTGIKSKELFMPDEKFEPNKVFNEARKQRQLILTTGQKRKADRWNLDWPTTWKRFRKLKLPPNVKSFMFKVLNNATPHFFADCPCGEICKTWKHIYKCESLVSTRSTIRSFVRRWFNFKVKWKEKVLFKMEMNDPKLHLAIAANWILWKVRNKRLIEDKKMARYEIRQVCKTVLRKIINFSVLWKGDTFWEEFKVRVKGESTVVKVGSDFVLAFDKALE